ncbi:hypothetical protein AB0G83_05385 [Streptomyces klenkii]|uniref:hypothetical protein n=1 Tax=Streptomyces TaxID=1883 RepID=UPI001892B20E|nr:MULTISPECIES: hypothetical protein [Streptomyces]
MIPADPARAVEAAAPEPARSYPARPVHAAEAVMLPDCWDVQDDDVGLGFDFGFDAYEHWGAASLILSKMGDLDGNTAGSHWADSQSGTSPVCGR